MRRMAFAALTQRICQVGCLHFQLEMSQFIHFVLVPSCYSLYSFLGLISFLYLTVWSFNWLVHLCVLSWIGMKKDGSACHYFYKPSMAYTTGTRKRRKIQTDGVQGGGSEVRWHKTGKTRPILQVFLNVKTCKNISFLGGFWILWGAGVFSSGSCFEFWALHIMVVWYVQCPSLSFSQIDSFCLRPPLHYQDLHPMWCNTCIIHISVRLKGVAVRFYQLLSFLQQESDVP